MHDHGIDQLAVPAVIARAPTRFAEAQPVIKRARRHIIDRNLESYILDALGGEIGEGEQKKARCHTAPQGRRHDRHRNQIGASPPARTSA